jgi:hypothetical protein
MVLMGNRGTEQSHHPITGELIDRPLVSVDLIHQNLETAIHDLMDLFGIKLFGQRREIGHIREENRHLLPLPLDGASGGQDFIGEEPGRVGLGLGVIDGRDFWRRRQFMTAITAENVIGENFRPTTRAGQSEFCTALPAKLFGLWILRFTKWTMHAFPPTTRPGWNGWGL